MSLVSHLHQLFNAETCQSYTRLLCFAIAEFRVILSGPIPSSTRKGNA